MTQVETECKTIFWSLPVFVHFRPALCRAGHTTREMCRLDAVPSTAKRERDRVRVCGSVLEHIYATVAFEKRP